MERAYAAVTEKQLQQGVNNALRLNRIAAYHTWLSIRSVSGFPDTIAIFPSGLLLAIELKTEKGKLSAAQESWRDAFKLVERRSGGAVRWLLVRPSTLQDLLNLIAEELLRTTS